MRLNAVVVNEKSECLVVGSLWSAYSNRSQSIFVLFPAGTTQSMLCRALVLVSITRGTIVKSMDFWVSFNPMNGKFSE